MLWVFCIVKKGTPKGTGVPPRVGWASRSLNSSISGDTEMAGPLIKSRPEPNAELGIEPHGMILRVEEHPASLGRENGCQFLGGYSAFERHREPHLVVHALPVTKRQLGGRERLKGISAPELFGHRFRWLRSTLPFWSG